MQRKHQWALVIWFLAVIYIVPASQSSIEIVDRKVPQFLDVFKRFPTRPNLRTYEKALEDGSLIARAARPWIQYAWFVLFRDAGEKVLVGRDGWLFYRPDVRYLVEPAPLPVKGPGDPVAAVTHFRDQLRSHGIELMVIPMPGKPSLYGGMLTRRLSGGKKALSPTLNLIALLRGAGVETMNLFDLFSKRQYGSRQPYYLQQDTHWSADGAETAAAAVAARLEELGWASKGTTGYDVRPLIVRRQGDIAKMPHVPLIEASWPAEKVASHQVFERSTGTVYRDDPTSPVLVLGDSFMNIYQTNAPTAAGFIAHLACRLQRPVASIVIDGGGATVVRQELARRPQLLRGKKVVIWEFVERDIRFPAEGWQAVPLEPQAAIPAPSRNP